MSHIGATPQVSFTASSRLGVTFAVIFIAMLLVSVSASPLSWEGIRHANGI